jgi:hypothetical protein
MTAKATPTVSFRRTSRLCLAILSLAALANLPATAAGRGLRTSGNKFAATTNRVLATKRNLQKREIAIPIPMKDIENIISLELSMPHVDEGVGKMSLKSRKRSGRGKGKGKGEEKGKGKGNGKGVRGSKYEGYDDDYVESHEKYYELGYEENCAESHPKKSKGHYRKRRCKPKECK